MKHIMNKRIEINYKKYMYTILCFSVLMFMGKNLFVHNTQEVKIDLNELQKEPVMNFMFLNPLNLDFILSGLDNQCKEYINNENINVLFYINKEFKKPIPLKRINSLLRNRDDIRDIKLRFFFKRNNLKNCQLKISFYDLHGDSLKGIFFFSAPLIGTIYLVLKLTVLILMNFIFRLIGNK